jgi:hypothetical protein
LPQDEHALHRWRLYELAMKFQSIRPGQDSQPLRAALKDFGVIPKDFGVAPQDFGNAPRDYNAVPKYLEAAPKFFTVAPETLAAISW